MREAEELMIKKKERNVKIEGINKNDWKCGSDKCDTCMSLYGLAVLLYFFTGILFQAIKLHFYDNRTA